MEQKSQFAVRLGSQHGIPHVLLSILLPMCVFPQFKAQVQSDIKTIAQKLESLSELHTRIEEYQANSVMAAASVNLKIKAMEGQVMVVQYF